jgi:hypothetical protein
VHIPVYVQAACISALEGNTGDTLREQRSAQQFIDGLERLANCSDHAAFLAGPHPTYPSTYKYTLTVQVVEWECQHAASPTGPL